jgi:hypothetical protein
MGYEERFAIWDIAWECRNGELTTEELYDRFLLSKRDDEL